VSKLGMEDPEDNYGTKVAVKLFNKPFDVPTRETEVIRKMMTQKFFVKYKGYITHDNRLGLVMNRCEYSLIDVFRSYGITYLDTLDYALQIAKGIQFLHRNRIVHRNLKLTNILAKRKSEEEENKWRLLISDFDLYKQPEQVPLPENTNQTWLKAYLPPEMLRKGTYGYTGDSWAYGWLVMEMSNACGFSTFPLNRLIARCRLNNPDSRTNFDDIIHKLEKMIERQGMETRKDRPLAKHAIEDGCDHLERQMLKLQKQQKREQQMLEKQKHREREKHDGKNLKKKGKSDDEYGEDGDSHDEESDGNDGMSLRRSISSARLSPRGHSNSKKDKKKKKENAAEREEERERERERLRQKVKSSGSFSSYLPPVKDMSTKITKLIDI